MFAKPDSVLTSSRSTMRNKEAKALKQTIGSLFLARLSDVDELLSSGSLDLIKYHSKMTGYCRSGETPLFIDLDSKGHNLKLVPTLQALWLCPGLLPVVLIPPEVSPYIVGGADLMLPGCFTPLPNFKKGDLLAVRVCGNPCAIAVGEALLSSAEAQGAAGMKGRCLRSLLHFGDLLWDSAGRVRPNEGFKGNSISPIEVEATPGFVMPESALAMLMSKVVISGETPSTSNNSISTAIASDGPEDTSVTAAGPEGSSPAWRASLDSADSTGLLQLTLFQVLRCSRHLKQSELPMLASVFFGTVMQAARPKNRELDLKKSVFKKASHFFHAMEEEGVLKLDESPSSRKGTPGELVISSVNRQHELVLEHRPWPASEEVGGDKKEEEKKEVSSAPLLTAATGGGEKFVAPTVTQFLMPQRLHSVIINTVNAALLSQDKSLCGHIQLKGRRGGPISQKKLNTKIVSLTSIVGSAAQAVNIEQQSSSSRLPDLLRLLPSPEKLLLKKNEAVEILSSYIKLCGLSQGKTILVDKVLGAFLTGKVLSEATVEIVEGASSTTGDHDDDDEVEGGGGDGKATSSSESTRIPCIQFNPLDLSSLLVNTSTATTSISDRIDREELLRMWVSKMDPWYAISVVIPQPSGLSAEEIVVKRGEPPTIEITKKKGQANRSSTHIVGADRYGLDLQELARALQKSLACSATVQPNKENPTLTEVMLSGDEAKRARDWLLKEADLNPSFVKVL
jgi:predicted ribosome-associated RNA-binding protein Tma20/translation initiation factor 1 (eIF-1/SUI1)